MVKEPIAYLIKSREYYKIGKCEEDVNLETRLNAYNTHNPDWQLICTKKGDIEKYLHFKFEKKRYRHEWFVLDEEDIEWIRETDIQNTEDYKKFQRVRKWAREEEQRKKQEAKFLEWAVGKVNKDTFGIID